MKAFRFGLQKALEWRALEQRAAEQKLAQLQQQIALIVREDGALADACKQAESRCLAMPTVTAADLQALAAFQKKTQKHRDKLRTLRVQCESLVDDQRQRLLKARKDHRVLEKLKERRWKSWSYLNEREEEQTSEEVYLSNWTQRVAEGRPDSEPRA